jgi:hypothetical protein
MTTSDESRISINLLLLTLQLILHLCMHISRKNRETHPPKDIGDHWWNEVMVTTQFSWSNVILSIKIDVNFQDSQCKLSLTLILI